MRPRVAEIEDSALEGTGFEPSVPLEVLTVGIVPCRLSTFPSRKRSSQRTQRWREMDSNFRFPDAPSGRSAEARTFSSGREFAPLAWRDRDFEPPAPSRVDLCVRTRTVSGT